MPTATILLQNGDWSTLSSLGDTGGGVGVSASLFSSLRLSARFSLASLPLGVTINSVTLRITFTFTSFPAESRLDIAQGTFEGNTLTSGDWGSFGDVLATTSTPGTGVRQFPLSPSPSHAGGEIKLMFVAVGDLSLQFNTVPAFDGSKMALLIDYADPPPEGEVDAALADCAASFSGYVPIVGEVSGALGGNTLDMRESLGTGVDITIAVRNAWATRAATGGSGVAGLGAGRVEVYGGERPGTGDVVDSPPLVVFDLPSLNSGNVAGGVVTVTGIPPATVLTTGTPTWARIYDGGGLTLADIDVVLPGQANGIAFSTPTVTAGQVLRLGGFSYEVR